MDIESSSIMISFLALLVSGILGIYNIFQNKHLNQY